MWKCHFCILGFQSVQLSTYFHSIDRQTDRQTDTHTHTHTHTHIYMHICKLTHWQAHAPAHKDIYLRINTHTQLAKIVRFLVIWIEYCKFVKNTINHTIGICLWTRISPEINLWLLNDLMLERILYLLDFLFTCESIKTWKITVQGQLAIYVIHQSLYALNM